MRHKILIYPITICLFILSFSIEVFADSKTYPLEIAIDRLASQLVSAFTRKDPDISIAILPIKNSGTGDYKTFESRITEILTDKMKGKLRPNYSLSDRLNLKNISEDLSLSGSDKDIDKLLENTKVNIYITGSYRVVSKNIEIRYSAIDKENNRTISAAMTYTPIASLTEGSEHILLSIRTTIEKEGIETIVKQVSDRIKNNLTKKNFNIVVDKTSTKTEESLKLAVSQKASILIVINVEGKETLMEYGFRKGFCHISASLYQMPKGDITANFTKEWTLGTANEDEKPLEQAALIATDNIIPEIVDKLQGRSENQFENVNKK
jgi:hypothetical protein